MAKASWNGAILAESDDFERVESKKYFPPLSVNWQYFKRGKGQYSCPHKGEAVYWDITVNDKLRRNAAWSYPNPKAGAENIKEYVAFDTNSIDVED